MEQSLQVNFESPQSGWMSLSLESGDQRFIRVISWTPYDSVKELIEALLLLLKEEGERIVRWNSEPEEFDFRLKREEDSVSLEIVRYQDHRRLDSTSQVLFSVESSNVDICIPFWKALRDLRRRIARDEFDKNWRRPFPYQELNQLTKSIKAERRKELNSSS
jgi:hypothetical protein